MLQKDFSRPTEPVRVPGELLVKLTDAAAAQITTTIPPGPIRRIPFPLPKAFGIQRIDECLGRHGVASINRLHGPIPAERQAADEATRRLGGKLAHTYRVKFASMEADLDAAKQEMEAMDEVEEVGYNHFFFTQARPNDPGYDTQWGLERIRCPAAWELEKGDPNVVVAVVDSGVDLDHPDLIGNIVAGHDSVDLPPYETTLGDTLQIGGEPWVIQGDIFTPDNIAQDEVGHGTHVAGTIAAVTNNTAGVAGVAWNCSIQPIRAMFAVRRVRDGLVSGIGTSADIAAGIRWATDNGADIINMSLGGYADDMIQRDAVNYALRNNVLVVAAMGNENVATPSYPAAYPGVLAVGATDQRDTRAQFSNFGDHIDVVAPGVRILSTYWNNTYSTLDGTSMAAPHVAGLAALILSRNRRLTPRGGGRLTARAVSDMIRETARGLQDSPNDRVPNNWYGYGLIDTRAALDRLTVPPPVDNEEDIAVVLARILARLNRIEARLGIA